MPRFLSTQVGDERGCTESKDVCYGGKKSPAARCLDGREKKIERAAPRPQNAGSWNPV